METVFGFVDLNSNLFDIRAKFNTLVGIVDKDEIKILTILLKNFTKIIQHLQLHKNVFNHRVIIVEIDNIIT